jgi:hypothetical protein
MTKRLIASALIAAQLLPWASGAMYVCVASDGSVGVDRGPASCSHCHSHVVAEQPSSCGAKCCHDHDDTALCDDAVVLARGACDCHHVLISPAQATTAARQSTTDVQQLSFACSAALPTPTSPTLAASVENSLRFGPSCELPAHLRALGSIVLRC